ncbi:MAG: phosphoribosyl-ATP pyrophosphohydrolase [Firmicutes bacterium]|nr:phosphoribosyl-ATP pyrophosphohydrolase [Bacillota bacterium]
MKIYNKLVRDKIPEIMIKNGAKPVTKILSDEEYKLELNKKLLEEVNEYLESDDILELADIQEVLLALINTTNMTYEEFEKIRKEKVSKRGAFDNKIFLEKEE